MRPEDAIEHAWGVQAREAIERALRAAVAGREGVYFDFDNTLIRGDVGDLVMLEVLSSATLSLPETLDAWGPLTAAAREQLTAAFGSRREVTPEDPRRVEVTRALSEIVWHEALADGRDAFDPPRTSAFRGGYFAMAAIVDGLDAGLRVTLTQQAWERATERDLGDLVHFGTYAVERFARPRPVMLALYELAEEAGLAPWIVSASHEDAVRTVARAIGLNPERVIGARPSRSRGMFPAIDGAPVMTYDAGKRASIVHQLEGAPALDAHRTRARTAIAAGDSDTDHAMLEDASALIVVVERGQPRLSELARSREQAGRVAVLRVPFQLE